MGMKNSFFKKGNRQGGGKSGKKNKKEGSQSVRGGPKEG